MNDIFKPTPIAIVGIGGIFPGATDVAAFWQNIINSRDLITEVPANYWLKDDYYQKKRARDKIYTTRGGFLPNIPFDPLEFNLVPKDLSATDTLQLLSLIVAKTVLNDAASVQFNNIDRNRMSVILGVSGLNLVGLMYSRTQLPVWKKVLQEFGLTDADIEQITRKLASHYPSWRGTTFPGLLKNVVAGRIANRLNLGGINCIVDAACASSIAAVKMAVEELYLGHSDLVITGGGDALNNSFLFMCFSQTPALSPTGDCRPFAANADGTLLGEGVGMVALRRLADAERDGDKIYALINAVGASSDGVSKGMYAPTVAGQARAIQHAFSQVDFSPAEVELVEAHGTGTVIGDIAEFTALCSAFSDAPIKREQFCALGSIKSQIGHAKAAAGSAALLKVALALHHKVLPPTIKVAEPNPKLNIENSPFYLNTQARPWISSTPSSRKASLSSFGFGGSNFHVILEEYCGEKQHALRFYQASVALILHSADNLIELRAKLRDLSDKLQLPQQNGLLVSLARDSQLAFDATQPLRIALLMVDVIQGMTLITEVLTALEVQPDSFTLPYAYYVNMQGKQPGKLAFLFAGQGAYVNMGAELAMEFDEARKVWEQASRVITNESLTLAQVNFPPPVFSTPAALQQTALLTQMEWAEPAIGAMSLAQLALLKQVEITADFCVGHNFGEILALYATEAITSDEVWRLLQQRSRTLGEYTVANHVSFKQQLAELYQDGARIFLEVGPSDSLSQVVRASLPPDCNVIALDKPQESLVAFWRALGQLAVQGIAVQFRHLWDKFVVSSDLLGQTTKHSDTTVMINGSHFMEPEVIEPIDNVVTTQAKDDNSTIINNYQATDCVNPQPFVASKTCSSTQKTQFNLITESTQMTNSSTKSNDFSDWLAAFEILQRNALDAHKSLQNSLMESHRQFLQVTETAIGQLGGLSSQSNPHDDTQTLNILRHTFKNLATSAELIDSADLEPVNLNTAGQNQPRTAINSIETNGFAHVDSNSNSSFSREAMKQLILKVAAEKTGFPEKLIDLNADLEAEMGVDSIRRVEIFSALEEHLPQLAKVDIAQLADLNTLNTILDFAEALMKEHAKSAASTNCGQIAEVMG